MALPTETDEWVVTSTTSGDNFSNLELNKSVPLEPLGADDILLEVKAVALNYRDLAIATNNYPLPTAFPHVPANDVSGTILAVGSAVTSLSVGDPVTSLPTPLLQTGHLTVKTHHAAGGGDLPGYLRRYLVLPASWFVHYPSHLTPVEASTLGTAGLSAWNALFGSGTGASAGGAGPRGVQKGDVVLTQGTGAVSLYAAAFAVLAGAKVIGTTGSEAKAPILTELGVQTVLNYREDKTWGETARGLTQDGEGVDMVVDVGGAGTLGQSLKAIRYDGTVAVTGFLTGGREGPGPTLMETLPRASNVRGILAGSRAQFDEMAGKIEEWKFRPVVDKKVFGFEQVKDAYAYVWAQKHIGKVVIEVNK